MNFPNCQVGDHQRGFKQLSLVSTGGDVCVRPSSVYATGCAVVCHFTVHFLAHFFTHGKTLSVVLLVACTPPGSGVTIQRMKPL